MMDPISTLFSVYLETMTNMTHRQIIDTMNGEVTPVVIRYEDMEIGYQHQLWKIKDASVCASYKQEFSRYAACTVKAKKMFTDMCRELSSINKNDVIFTRARNMYCNAAIAYEPTIADISVGTEPAPLQQAQRKCNQATVAALGKTNRQLISERDQACSIYKELKNRP